jgi:hypothetical protein
LLSPSHSISLSLIFFCSGCCWCCRR